MIFTRKYIPHNSPPIKINNKKIEIVDKIKFLGMNLDPKLNWTNHINSIRKKCDRGINILKAINRTWWGGHPSICLLIYKALIRSMIDYGSFI